MKKILVSALSVIALAVLGTGCLKDKDFEDQRYGTVVGDARAVSFPQSRSANSITYGVVSSITSQDIQGPIIAIEGPTQSSDVNVTLQVNDALVTADPTLTVLPASEYTLDLTRTIPAGAVYDSAFMITLPNSSNLDPNLIYAIGLTIASADNGFSVASNMRNLVLKFTVKNKYDGVYTITGTYVDNSNANFSGRYPLEYRLVTTGPASVDVQLLVNGSWDPAYLFSNNGAGSFYGSYGLTMTFDPTTDDIIDLHNYYGDPSKAITAVGNPSLGSGAPNFASSNGRRAVLDPTGLNNWDGSGATPIITIKHFMLQPSVVPVGPRVELDEVWEYTGPRP